jgi:hypothetical protein
MVVGGEHQQRRKNNMEILSPKVIKFDTTTMITSHTGSFEYIDPIFNISMTKSITTLTFGQFGHNQPAIALAVTASTDERVKIFAGMQALIKSCVDNAEDIKNRIHQIVIGKSQPKSEEERVEIMRMDFMKLKQLFMDEIRNTKIYKEFTEFNSTKKLKTYSQTFNTFILDRNKYTHGQLCFLSPSYDFVLEYIETPALQKCYARVNVDILRSYNNTYVEIKKLISEYNVIKQTKLIDDHNKRQAR